MPDPVVTPGAVNGTGREAAPGDLSEHNQVRVIAVWRKKMIFQASMCVVYRKQTGRLIMFTL
jgi:hypothetical protein